MQNILKIQNLGEKLRGELPINREELFHLVNSWGRKDTFSSLDQVIYKTKSSNKYDLENLDISQIEDFSFIFTNSNFNGDISKWNMSNAINLESMFYRSDFNNDSICNWKFGKVESMRDMFKSTRFNQDISLWDFSTVKDISLMFANNKEFNQPLNNINTNSLVFMNHTFAYTEKFNQPLDKWNTSNVIDFTGTFFNAKSFNQPLDSWDVKNGKKFSYMLNNSKSPTNILSWNINKEADLNYFVLNNKEVLKICNKGNNIPSSTSKFLKWFEKAKNKILYKEKMKNEFSKENMLNDFDR